MVTPCLEKGDKKKELTTIKLYGPKNSNWYRLNNGELKKEGYS